MISFDVLGTPAPKGSGRAMLIRSRGAPRAIHVASGSDANKQRLKSWDTSVREAAAEAIDRAGVPAFVQTPIAVRITFRLARPGGHWGKTGLRPSAPAFPAGKPDADKLARATIDSLTGTLFDDDSRIVSLRVEKRYAEPGREGASIAVVSMAHAQAAFQGPDSRVAAG
jgi:Holliday junction resolvase RusA-like endonuclease